MTCSWRPRKLEAEVKVTVLRPDLIGSQADAARGCRQLANGCRTASSPLGRLSKRELWRCSLTSTMARVPRLVNLTQAPGYICSSCARRSVVRQVQQLRTLHASLRRTQEQKTILSVLEERGYVNQIAGYARTAEYRVCSERG